MPIAETPPVYVTVQSTGIPTWIQIATLVIALLALTVTGMQFIAGRRDRAQSRPNIKCGITYSDKYHIGGEGEQKVVAFHVQNLGAEATKLNLLGVGTNYMYINGLNCLLGSDGKRLSNEEYARVIEPYSSESFYVDAERIDADSVDVAANFGHGATVNAIAALNKQVAGIVLFPKPVHWYTPWRRGPASYSLPKKQGQRR